MTYYDISNNMIDTNELYYIIGKEANTITGDEIINLIESNEIISNDVIAKSNTSDYFICVDCGRVFSYRHFTYHTLSDGDYICDCCFCDNDYCYCNDCGYVYSIDDMIYCDSDDEYYCYNCIDNHTRDDDESIHNYHYHKGKEHFLSTNDDNTSLYFGMELEVEKNNYSISNDDVASYIYNNICDKVYFESDGSLRSGFEIITHPFTFNYWRDVLSNNYKDMCDYLIDNDYKSNDTSTCGLHIHISKKALGNTVEEINDNVNKIILFTEYYKDDIIKFARRGSTHYMQFLSDYLYDNNMLKDKLEAQSIKTIDSEKNDTRYFAINNTNDNTLEFRIFKGTLKYSTIYAYIEFINNLVEIIKKYSLNRISFSKVVNANKTTYLKEYLKERGIVYDNKYMQDATNKLKRLHNKRLKLINLLNSNIDLLLKDYGIFYKDVLNDRINEINEVMTLNTLLKSLTINTNEIYYYLNEFKNKFNRIKQVEFINKENLNDLIYYTNKIKSYLKDTTYTSNKIDLIEKNIHSLEVI